MLGKIQAIRGALLDTPALRDLRGYDWATFGRIDGQSGHPLKASLGIIAYPYFFNTKLNRAESSAEGAPFTISLNDPDIVVGHGNYQVDRDARFTFAPIAVGTLDGYPVYGNDDRFVVIMKDPKLLFVPVTQQQYLELRISQERKSFADLTTSLKALPDGPSKQAALDKGESRVEALEAELAALSPAERAAPALDPEGGPTKRASHLAETSALNTRAIVMPNPKVFDPNRPRTAVQLVVLGSVRYQAELFKQVQAQIDKAALLKLID